MGLLRSGQIPGFSSTGRYCTEQEEVPIGRKETGPALTVCPLSHSRDCGFLPGLVPLEGLVLGESKWPLQLLTVPLFQPRAGHGSPSLPRSSQLPFLLSGCLTAKSSPCRSQRFPAGVQEPRVCERLGPSVGSSCSCHPSWTPYLSGRPHCPGELGDSHSEQAQGVSWKKPPLECEVDYWWLWLGLLWNCVGGPCLSLLCSGCG